MRAEELMIGDWVLVDKEPIKTKQVCEDCIISDFGDGDEEVNCFEPIPLTPAILAKNGMETKDGDEFVLFDNSKIDTTGEFTIIRYYAKVCRLWICKGDGVIENEIHIDCQYVHELQHALKLCGIDKQIVL